MAPGLLQVAEDLAHKEWVAVCLAMHRLGKADTGVIERMARHRLHESHHRRAVETGEFEAGAL